MKGVVVVFAKAPRPGAVKTRMSPPLTPEQAAELYACLLADCLEATARAARELGLDAVVAVHPPEACREVSSGAPAPFRAVPQRGSGLAERMSHAAREAAAGGARRILLRGSDSPLLDTGILSNALRSLHEHDLVLCPDRDGGYNLVGLRAPAPSLFDHPMSTPSVLADTLANGRDLGLDCDVLPPSFDLDTIEDLRWLAEALSGGSTGTCEKTRAYLDKHSIWRYLVRSSGDDSP